MLWAIVEVQLHIHIGALVGITATKRVCASYLGVSAEFCLSGLIKVERRRRCSLARSHELPIACNCDFLALFQLCLNVVVFTIRIPVEPRLSLYEEDWYPRSFDEA